MSKLPGNWPEVVCSREHSGLTGGLVYVDEIALDDDIEIGDPVWLLDPYSDSYHEARLVSVLGRDYVFKLGLD